MARLKTDRTPVEIRGPDGGSLAEITDDRVTVYGERGQQTGGFREIEIELCDQGPVGRRLMRAAVSRLVAAGCRAEPPIPKVVRALGQSASGPPDVVVPPVGADATGRRKSWFMPRTLGLTWLSHRAATHLPQAPANVLAQGRKHEGVGRPRANRGTLHRRFPIALNYSSRSVPFGLRDGAGGDAVLELSTDPDATWAPSTRRLSCSDPDEGVILRLLQDGH